MNRGVIMKQLISLLLIISITVISWTSYAKNTVIQINTVYSHTPSGIHSMVLKPSLSNQHINEGFAISANQTTNKSHSFFELAVVFNEKLQQFIAFFTHLSDEVAEFANNDFTTTDTSPNINIQIVNKKCPTGN